MARAARFKGDPRLASLRGDRFVEVLHIDSDVPA